MKLRFIIITIFCLLARIGFSGEDHFFKSDSLQGDGKYVAWISVQSGFVYQKLFDGSSLPRNWSYQANFEMGNIIVTASFRHIFKEYFFDNSDYSEFREFSVLYGIYKRYNWGNMTYSAGSAYIFGSYRELTYDDDYDGFNWYTTHTFFRPSLDIQGAICFNYGVGYALGLSCYTLLAPNLFVCGLNADLSFGAFRYNVRQK